MGEIMSDENKDWIDAVTKLIKLTQEGELKWSSSGETAQVSRQESERVSVVFKAQHKNKYLRLYELQSRIDEPVKSPFFTTASYATEYATSVSGLFGAHLPQYPYWNKEVILEFTDYQGHALWKVPHVPPLRDLLHTVEYQVSGAGEFLKDIFTPDPQ